MVRRRRVNAAIAFAAALLVCVVLSTGRSRADDDVTQVMLFSGRDFWRNGVFAHSGLLIAPGGFDQDGLMLKLLTSGGAYRYWPRSLPGQLVIGAEWKTQILPGFRIKRGEAEIKFFLGPEWQAHWLRPDDPDNRLRGRSFGLRMDSELWWEPTTTTLIAGDASLTTIASGHSARIASGWRIADDMFNGDGFYVGPEFQVFDSDGYRQRRFGLHITSMKTEATEWSAAAGWARDSDGHSSVYVRLGLSQRLTR